MLRLVNHVETGRGPNASITAGGFTLWGDVGTDLAVGNGQAQPHQAFAESVDNACPALSAILAGWAGDGWERERTWVGRDQRPWAISVHDRWQGSVRSAAAARSQRGGTLPTHQVSFVAPSIHHGRFQTGRNWLWPRRAAFGQDPRQGAFGSSHG